MNCGYDGIAAALHHHQHLAERQAARARSRRNPHCPVAERASPGSSAYHSLQVTLRRHASHGLTFQAAYTYSRAATDTSIYNDPNNLALDWARAGFDRTHRFTTNFDYQLPRLHRGRESPVSLSRDWTLAGIIIVQSGLPMTLTDPNGGGVYGHAAPSTVTLCPGASYAGLVTPGAETDG